MRRNRSRPPNPSMAMACIGPRYPGRRRFDLRSGGDDGSVPNYLVRKKLIALGDDFWVEDEAGERVFHVDGKVMRLRDTYVIETPDGQEVLRIRERRLKLRKTLAIERRGDELATVSKALLTPLRDKFKIELAGHGTLEARG